MKTLIIEKNFNLLNIYLQNVLSDCIRSYINKNLGTCSYSGRNQTCTLSVDHGLLNPRRFTIRPAKEF